MLARLAVPLLALLLAACSSAPVAPVKRVAAAPAASERAAGVAVKMVGKPYRAGGAGAATGFDCSGLVQFSYRQAGVSVPRSTELQLRASKSVSRAGLRRGDLVFFDQEGKKKSHVGIYLGDGRFVHAPSSGKQVRIDRLDSRYWQAHLSDTRRF
ncbi:MAG: C40 family peptidase [Burkholderiales bacterium]